MVFQSQLFFDRDRVFTSQFWKEIFRMVGTELHYSSSYHPQIDGQSERLNQCLESYLRCMCSEHPSLWGKWLPVAEFWYNSTFHTSLQHSPFEALYGHKPNHLQFGPYHGSIIPATTSLVQDRIIILANIKNHLMKAQSR